MIAQTNILLAKTYSDVVYYQYFLEIPTNKFNDIDTMYIKDINILINNNYTHNDKFINIKNLKYIYLEDTVDLDVLNNSKLIDNFNFEKLVLFDLDINSNKPKKSIINTSTINKNKMVLIIANCEIPLVPWTINSKPLA